MAYAPTRSRQENGVAVLGSNQIASHTVLLHPLRLTNLEQLLELVGRGQRALIACSPVGYVECSLIGIGTGIVVRIEAGVTPRHVAKGEEPAEVGLSLGTEVMLGPTDGYTHIDKLVVNVDGVAVGRERCHIAIDHTGAKVEEGSIVVGSTGQQAFLRIAEVVSQLFHGQAQTSPDILHLRRLGDDDTADGILGIFADGTCHGCLCKVDA